MNGSERLREKLCFLSMYYCYDRETERERERERERILGAERAKEGRREPKNEKICVFERKCKFWLNCNLVV